MDGRAQKPVIDYINDNHGTDYVDMITLPGPNKVLFEEKEDMIIESIKRYVDISINQHGSTLIAVCGHYDCAGNPTDKDTGILHIRKSKEIVSSWGFDAKVIGLWIDENFKAVEV